MAPIGAISFWGYSSLPFDLLVGGTHLNLFTWVINSADKRFWNNGVP
jgi:hypothetical protein